MKLLEKIEDLKVDEKDPFKNDQLNRKNSIINLFSLIETVNQSFVISVSSPCGTGKTVFVKMLKAKLESSGHNCFYYNAWENDFVNDPVISMIGEIENQIENFESASKCEKCYHLA